ncbi:MAG: flagellar hook assembly protein FlgD [Candidatus Latescibacterota bacterium]|nr:flagellar hook assembly protein FlgD [Candidatus Latescibacterota bacterium]MEE3042947.1 flagellar hook assembly protein FlgD [Candidatus Latescibacterota bacterium]
MSEIASLTSSPTTERTVNQANANLGKEDFLKLLTVQLRYQDPLNPMENTEFIAQMAQFSSLEQLQNMNQSLDRNLGSEQQLHTAFQNNLATSLVGRTVEIPTIEVDWTGEEPAQIGYRLDDGARTVQMQILDGRGQLVREFELDPSETHGVVRWDGVSRLDSEVPEGAYRVLILAEDHGGGRVRAEALKQVEVEAVRYDATGASIWAGGQRLSLEDLSGVIADN